MSDIREGKGYMSGLLALSNDSVPKMLLVTVVLCLVCSVLVSGAAVYLRPLSLGPIGQGTWILLEGQTAVPGVDLGNPILNYQVATPGSLPFS